MDNHSHTSTKIIRHSANKQLHLVSEHVGITFKHRKSQSVTNEELFTVLEPTAPCDDSRVRQCIEDRQTDSSLRVYSFWERLPYSERSEHGPSSTEE